MKNTLACPKCESRRLWRIERVRTGESPLRVKWGWGEGIFAQEQSLGHFDAYVCAECGYSELFACDYEELEDNPEEGVHFIDNTPQRGEYR